MGRAQLGLTYFPCDYQVVAVIWGNERGVPPLV